MKQFILGLALLLAAPIYAQSNSVTVSSYTLPGAGVWETTEIRINGKSLAVDKAIKILTDALNSSDEPLDTQIDEEYDEPLDIQIDEEYVLNKDGRVCATISQSTTGTGFARYEVHTDGTQPARYESLAGAEKRGQDVCDVPDPVDGVIRYGSGRAWISPK